MTGQKRLDEYASTTERADTTTSSSSHLSTGHSRDEEVSQNKQCSLPPQVADPTEYHQQQLLERAQAHARSVDLAVDLDTIEWDVSTNAQRTRRAGDCRYNRQTGQLTITLTWAAYAALGWEAFSETIRHELVHAYQFAQTGQSGHGQAFKRLARQVDTHVHCQRFTTGRLLLRCGEGCEDHRDKASTVVKHPERARCRPHDASLTVEHVATGWTWTDHDGYERQRAAIERMTDAEW